MDEGKFGSPRGWEFGRGADGEVDVGGEGGVAGEEARFDVDAVEMDRFGEVVLCVAEPRACFYVGCDVVRAIYIYIYIGRDDLPEPVPISRTSLMFDNEMGGRMRRLERRRVYSRCCAISLHKVKWDVGRDGEGRTSIPLALLLVGGQEI